jgi:hypothetical protein
VESNSADEFLSAQNSLAEVRLVERPRKLLWFLIIAVAGVSL